MLVTPSKTEGEVLSRTRPNFKIQAGGEALRLGGCIT